MSFNPELTIGNVLMIATLIVTAVGGYHALKGSVQSLSSDVAHSLNAIRELLKIHNERMDRTERRYDERLSTIEETLSRVTAVVERLSGRWDGYERRRDHNGHDDKGRR